MTLRRAALYVGGASLLVAWFSSAASLSLPRSNRSLQGSAVPSPSPTDDLAAEVQQHANRLRQRLAAAPLPQQPVRNPFTFRTVPPKARPIERAVEPPPPALPAAPAEPALTLIGIAEHRRPAGLVRTAMIATAGEELMMATVDDILLQRYKVTAIGHDTIELTDVATGQVRRISMP
jgi:hypothetical protein